MSESSEKNLEIRIAREGDAAALSRLVRDLLTFERDVAGSRNSINPWASSEEEILKQLAVPGMRFFVAVDEGSIVGYLRAIVTGRESSPEGATARFSSVMEKAARWFYYRVLRRPRPAVRVESGYIAGVYVVPEARRTGIGKDLVRVAERWFHAQGLKACELHVLYENEGARKLWESLGYEPLTLGMRKRLDRDS